MAAWPNSSTPPPSPTRWPDCPDGPATATRSSAPRSCRRSPRRSGWSTGWEYAESQDHHPDIDIRWRTLTFRCATHSKGGITDLDVALAAAISAEVQDAGGQ